VLGTAPHTAVPTSAPRPPGWERWPDGGGPPGGTPPFIRIHPRPWHHDFPWCGNDGLPCGPGAWPAGIPTLVIIESAHLSGQEDYSEIVYSCAAGLARIDHPNGIVLLDERGRRVSFYDRDADTWSEQSLDDWAASVDSIVWWTQAHSRPAHPAFEASGDTVLVAGFECAPFRLSVEVDDGDRVMQIAQAVWVTRDVETTPAIYATYRNMQRLFDDQWLDVCAERPDGFVFRTRGVKLPVPLAEGESAEIAEATIVDIGYRLRPLTFFQRPTWRIQPGIQEPMVEK